MSLGKIEIALNSHGTGTVLLDGVDMAKWATSIDIHSEPGRPPEVEIRYMAEVRATVDRAVLTHVVALGPFVGKGPTLEAALADVLRQKALA